MVTVHRQPYVCRPADQVIHPDHETRRQVLERHYWEVTALMAARRLLAEQCPQVAAGRDLPMRLAVRENEFTVHHRPLHLRILLAACDTCPDPEPLEPIMPTDPAEAEIVHAAALNTLGRLRYYAQTDPHLRGLVEEFDGAVAAGLGIPADQVADRTHTTPAPTDREAEFERLLEGSSLAALADDESVDPAMVRDVMNLAVTYLHSEQGRDGSVRLLASVPDPIVRQVRTALVDLAGVLREAQDRAPRPADPAPDA
ncbi:hypothetical protein [Streptomyces longwoodensis]|uniref:hypothetical protein n=1 Tax=Streptomyces longwoodensis TaxID=68231 RepID=UPI0036F67DF8